MQMGNSNRNTLKLAHLNINGLKTKVSALAELMEEHDIDIMSINETKVSGTDVDLTIPGYKFYRKDRLGATSGRHGGGVAFYINDHLPHTQPQSNHEELESLWTKVGRIVVGAMYRPPGKDNFEDIKEDIESMSTGSPFILMGDLNYNDSLNNPCIEELKNEFNCEQLVESPTRPSGSLVDVALTNIPQSISETEVITDLMDVVSDHYMVETVLDLDACCDTCGEWFKNKRGVSCHRTQSSCGTQYIDETLDLDKPVHVPINDSRFGTSTYPEYRPLFEPPSHMFYCPFTGKMYACHRHILYEYNQNSDTLHYTRLRIYTRSNKLYMYDPWEDLWEEAVECHYDYFMNCFKVY